MSYKQQVKLAELFGDSSEPGYSLNLTKPSKIRINDVIFPCSITAIGTKLVSRAVKFDPGSYPKIILKIFLNDETITLIPKAEGNHFISASISSYKRELEKYKVINEDSIATIDKLNSETHNNVDKIFKLNDEIKEYKEDIQKLEDKIKELNKIRNRWELLDI